MGGIWGSKKAPEPEADFSSLFCEEGVAKSKDGQAWDARLVALAVEYFQRKHRIDLHRDPIAIQRLTDGAARIRKELTVGTSARLHLPFLAADASGPKVLDWEISRRSDQQLQL